MSFFSGFPFALVGFSLLFCACEEPNSEPTQQEIDQRKMIASMVERQSANYAELQTESATLHMVSEAYCESKTDAGYIDLKAQWVTTFLRWGKAQWLFQGPVDEDDQFQRIEAWPTADSDRVMQSVEQILVIAPPDIDETYIANSPTQAQGFPAMEYLLFAAGKDALSARQCDLFSAISSNLKSMTTRIHSDWSDVYVNLLINPNPGFGFSSSNESMNFLVNQFLNLLVVVKDKKLGAPLGFDKDGGRGNNAPQASEAWISKQSLSAIAANIQALQELFKNEEMFGIDDYLVSLDKVAVSDEIQEKLSALSTQLDELQDMGFLLDVDIKNDAFVSLYESVQQLEIVVKGKMFPGIGATITFNFNDGD
ncbi:MAG: imelysin family protein [Kofleriaceae bacterium]|nr:imelysin family protein [Kofleriaceae bacterium]